MIFLHQKKNNNAHTKKYAVLRPDCLGMHCFNPNIFILDPFDPERNSPIIRSLKLYKYKIPYCKGLYRKECPKDREFDSTLFSERTKEGWIYSLW